jgi:glycosyltransferase involved in cell wall biosynthesis
LKIIGFDKVIVSTGNGQKYLAGSIVFKNNFIFIQHTYLDCLNFDTRRLFNFESIIKNLIINSNFNYLTVSNFSKRYIENSFFNKTINFEIKVLYNPSNFLDLDIFDVTISKEKNRIISTFGHLEEYKNPSFWLDTALQILNKFNDVIFIWAGDGTLYNEIYNKIPESFKNRVLLIGEISNVEDILKKTTIYFQPSIIESLGISVIDAMTYSIPCITSKCGGLPELVIHNKTGFLIDFNVESSVKYLSLLLNNKNLREKFGQEGRQRVIEKFSYTTWKNEILSYINEEQ